MHNSVDIEVPVDRATGLTGARLKVTVWMPGSIPERPVVCFAFPGGGYSRRYWSLDVSENANDGQVGYHCDRGWVMVTVDHLGVGESTVPPEPLSLETIAAANHAAVEHVTARLAAGTIANGFPAIPEAAPLAIGQSMGGQFLLVL